MVNGRAAVRRALGPLLAIAVLGAPATAGAEHPGRPDSVAAGIASGVTVPSTEPVLPAAPVTVNEFLPEEQDIGECLGALERPGCGSGARGGARQTVVFLVMALGLVLVFGRIAYAVRYSRPAPSAPNPPPEL